MALTEGLHIDLFDKKDTLNDIFGIINSNFYQIREMLLLLGVIADGTDAKTILDRLNDIESRLVALEKKCGNCNCCTNGSCLQQGNNGNSGIIVTPNGGGSSDSTSSVQQGNGGNSGIIVNQNGGMSSDTLSQGNNGNSGVVVTPLQQNSANQQNSGQSGIVVE